MRIVFSARGWDDYLHFFRAVGLVGAAWSGACLLQVFLDRSQVVFPGTSRFTGLLGNPQSTAVYIGPMAAWPRPQSGFAVAARVSSAMRWDQAWIATAAASAPPRESYSVAAMTVLRSAMRRSTSSRRLAPAAPYQRPINSA